METNISLSKQSYVLSGPERIHISVLSDGKPENFEQPFCIYKDVQTIYDVIRKGLVKSSVKEKEFVGIYSKNRVEWVLTEQALYSFSMVSVALYDTLGPTASNFIISHADITCVVVENEKNLLTILESTPPCLKVIIVIDEVSSETISRAIGLGLQLWKFSEVEKIGEDHKNAYPEKPPAPDDIATINYTSGTTGTPKGVIITHSNFISGNSSGLASLRACTKDIIRSFDIQFSYLPLAHVYERYVQIMMLMEGASIGFYSGDFLKMLDDIKYLQPTILPAVPRVLNRIYDKIMGSANESSLKRFLIQMALSRKGKEVEQGIQRRNSIWDYLVFRKVQNALGGKVRIFFSGGAPASAQVLQFFRCALGCMVLEGYGQTGCSGMLTVTLPQDPTGGHVGPPSFCAAMKLVDVPEMHYYTKNDQGELCIKGPMVCKGYLKNPEETKRVFDEEGWLHTGDIATWLPNGVVKIIDRKKNIFKLSQGEYVAPEKIEIIYSRCVHVSQIYVYGDSLESFLVGIVVPDPEVLKKMYPETDIPALCKDPNVKSMILNELIRLGRENGLKSFEQVKNIYLHPDPFTAEQGLLTPTMKTKRPELKMFFELEIKKMYSLA